jgi:hypothetical protein
MVASKLSPIKAQVRTHSSNPLVFVVKSDRTVRLLSAAKCKIPKDEPCDRCISANAPSNASSEKERGEKRSSFWAHMGSQLWIPTERATKLEIRIDAGIWYAYAAPYYKHKRVFHMKFTNESNLPSYSPWFTSKFCTGEGSDALEGRSERLVLCSRCFRCLAFSATHMLDPSR